MSFDRSRVRTSVFLFALGSVLGQPLAASSARYANPQVMPPLARWAAIRRSQDYSVPQVVDIRSQRDVEQELVDLATAREQVELMPGDFNAFHKDWSLLEDGKSNYATKRGTAIRRYAKQKGPRRGISVTWMLGMFTMALFTVACFVFMARRFARENRDQLLRSCEKPPAQRRVFTFSQEDIRRWSLARTPLSTSTLAPTPEATEEHPACALSLPHRKMSVDKQQGKVTRSASAIDALPRRLHTFHRSFWKLAAETAQARKFPEKWSHGTHKHGDLKSGYYPQNGNRFPKYVPLDLSTDDNMRGRQGRTELREILVQK